MVAQHYLDEARASKATAQGDSELCGTAIECSLTGTFQLVLHQKTRLSGTPLESLAFPLLETQTEVIVHGFNFANYLVPPKAHFEIYSKSSTDPELDGFVGPTGDVADFIALFETVSDGDFDGAVPETVPSDVR